MIYKDKGQLFCECGSYDFLFYDNDWEEVSYKKATTIECCECEFSIEKKHIPTKEDWEIEERDIEDDYYYYVNKHNY